VAELTSFTPLTLTQETIDDVTRAAEPDDDVPNILARDLASQFSDYDGLSYEALSGGNSPYPASLGKEFLTDEEIIQLLAMNEDQSDIETGFSRVLTGAGREIIPSVAGIPGMKAGFAAGAALQAPIPPAGPLAVVAKTLIPLTTALIGGVFGYEGAKAAQDAIIGEEGVVLPDNKTGVLGAKTLVNIAAPLSGLRVVGKSFAKDFDIGAPTYAKHLKQQQETAIALRDAISKQGPSVAGSRNIRQMADAVKIPKEMNTIGRLNRFIEKSVKQAPDEKMDAVGRILIAGQAVGGAGGAMFAESVDPDGGLSRFTGEMIGSTASGLVPSLLKTLTNNKSLVTELFSKLRGTEDALRTKGMDIIYKDLIASDDPVDDVDSILRLLQNPEFEEIINTLGDGSSSTDASHLQNVFLRTGSPVIKGHQDALDNATNAGLGEKTTQQSQAFFNMYRDRIIALARTGDPAAVQVAADLMQANYEAGFNGRLNLATDARLQAFEKLSLDADGRTPETPNETSRAFYETTVRLMSQGRARERQMWESTRNSELNVKDLEDSGALAITGNPENPSVIEMLDNFLEPYKNLPEGLDAEKTKNLSNLLTYAQGLRERLTVNTPNVLDDMPASIAKKYEEIQSLGVTTRINPETNRVELAPTDLMGATQTNAQEKTARKKFNDVQEYFKGFDDTPSIADPDATISTRELIDARGTWLKSMRELSAGPTPDKDKARITGNFAELLLDIIEELPFDQNAKNEQKIARAYSKAFNDVFTRTFTGKAALKAKSGELRVPPELLSKKLFVGGSDALAVKLDGFDEMFKFLKDNNIDTTYETSDGVVLNTVTDTQDLMNRLLRNYLIDPNANKFDPQTGEISFNSLNKFREQFKTILDLPEFASVKNDLVDVDTAKQLLFAVNQEQLANEKRLSSLVTFKQLASDATESPITTINSAIGGGSDKPMANLKNLLEVVNNKDLTPEQQTDAMAGLQHAFLDWAVDKAGGNTLKEGNELAFKPSKLFQVLFTPIPKAAGKQSLLTVKSKPKNKKTDPNEFEYGGWLVENGVMDEEMADRIHKSLIEMVSYQAEVESGNVNTLMTEASGLMDLYLTMVGSAGATSLARRLGLRGGAGNIAIPSRGAKVVTDIYNKLPNQKLTKVMVNLFEDPKLFALHLKKARDAKDAGSILEQLQDNVTTKFGVKFPRTAASLIISDPEEIVDVEVGPNVGKAGETKKMIEALKNMPPSPAPQLQQPVPPPTIAPAPVAPPTASAARPVDRSQYAALFPNDMASGIIRSQDQGIGSLMG